MCWSSNSTRCYRPRYTRTRSLHRRFAGEQYRLRARRRLSDKVQIRHLAGSAPWFRRAAKIPFVSDGPVLGDQIHLGRAYASDENDAVIGQVAVEGDHAGHVSSPEIANVAYPYKAGRGSHADGECRN